MNKSWHTTSVVTVYQRCTLQEVQAPQRLEGKSVPGNVAELILVYARLTHCRPLDGLSLCWVGPAMPRTHCARSPYVTTAQLIAIVARLHGGRRVRPLDQLGCKVMPRAATRPRFREKEGRRAGPGVPVIGISSSVHVRIFASQIMQHARFACSPRKLRRRVAVLAPTRKQAPQQAPAQCRSGGEVREVGRGPALPRKSVREPEYLDVFFAGLHSHRRARVRAAGAFSATLSAPAGASSHCCERGIQNQSALPMPQHACFAARFRRPLPTPSLLAPFCRHVPTCRGRHRTGPKHTKQAQRPPHSSPGCGHHLARRSQYRPLAVYPAWALPRPCGTLRRSFLAPSTARGEVRVNSSTSRACASVSRARAALRAGGRHPHSTDEHSPGWAR